MTSYPWKFDETDTFIIRDSEGFTVCNTHEHWRRSRNRDDNRKACQDTANLIVAAPDLCAALEAIIKHPMLQSVGIAMGSEIEKAVDAIFKAKGE